MKRIRKWFVVLCMLVSLVFVLSGCDDKKDADESKKETIIPLDELDRTEQKSDIDNIENENITEARIYWANKVYRTEDPEVINELKNRIAQLELEELNPDDLEKVDGFYELYLIEDEKMIYHFLSSNALYIGGKCYGPDETRGQFDKEVIGYCRLTFWKD